MRFYTTQHPFYCGIDLHARTMYVCILDQNSESLVHRNMTNQSGGLPERHGPVSTGACRRSRVPVHLVLAGRPVR